MSFLRQIIPLAWFAESTDKKKKKRKVFSVVSSAFHQFLEVLNIIFSLSKMNMEAKLWLIDWFVLFQQDPLQSNKTFWSREFPKATWFQKKGQMNGKFPTFKSEKIKLKQVRWNNKKKGYYICTLVNAMCMEYTSILLSQSVLLFELSLRYGALICYEDGCPKKNRRLIEKSPY